MDKSSLFLAVFILLSSFATQIHARDIHLHIDSVEDAVQYVSDETNVLNYPGLVFGSSEFTVSLPSGKKVSNWLINCMFSEAFRNLGKESIPFLINFLGSDTTYLRVGACDVLMQKAGRYDERSYSDDPVQRHIALSDWKTWWKNNKNNPRLDSAPKRVYSAKDWELQHIDN